jgi:integrase/recombinase XerD
MSVTTKLILRTNKTISNGEHPIILRITIHRQSQFISLKKTSSIENWDVRSQTVLNSHEDHKMINALIKGITAKIDLLLLNAGSNGTIVTFDEIKNIVLKATNMDKGIKMQSLFNFFESEIKRLKEQNRIGYAADYSSTLKCLKNFTGDRDCSFFNIQLDFLKKFEAYLILKGNAITTRSVYFRTFRTLWKTAIADKICPENHYPFKDFAFSKYNNPRTKKRAITKAQIELIANKEINKRNDSLNNSRNYLKFSFYCRGLNFTDLASLKWENIKDGGIEYTRSKTKEEFQFKLHLQE